MKYSKYIEINPIFQSSINIAFDLNDESKIQQYIPTREACSLLEFYIDSMMATSPNRARASMLYGPYGKGKSFLVLVLLYLISSNPNSPVYISLLGKIREVNSSLFSKIKDLNNKKFRLMPVIINSDYDDLDQAFMIGLTEAQNREGLGQIVSKTTFDVAREVIGKWLEKGKENTLVIELCQKKYGIDVKELKKRLEKNESKAYKEFCTLYECVSGGIPFNPLIRKNAALNIKTVAENISSLYSGVFVVFDEFSKFIESRSTGLSQQLKVLQDVFEIATRSGETAQVHICCINHKRLSNYTKSIPSDGLSSFKTIDGRVEEINFTRTIGENYWIISKALIKKKSFEGFWKEYSLNHQNEFKWYVDNGFVDYEVQDDLFKGCFPLSPLAAYSLIQLSEMVAQNERTLFTFISDNDSASLNSFIHNNSSNTYRVDSIYDYFSPLLAKEEENETKNSWIKAESILSQLVDEEDRKIIKTIAVSQIIRDSRRFPSTFEYLEKALDVEDLSSRLDSLENRSYLVKDFVTNSYALSSYSTKDIKRAIQEYRATHRTFNVSETMKTISSLRFIPVRKYNAEHKMVRYYKMEYIEASVFCSLASLRNDQDVLSDGVIYQVYFSSDTSVEQVRKAYSNLKKDHCVIVAVASTVLSDKELSLISDYCALFDLCFSKKIDTLLLNEMRILRDTMKSSIRSFLQELFVNSQFLSETDYSSVPEIMNCQLENTYSFTPTINNELLNKHSISKVYQKSRNIIVQRVLSGQTDFSDLSETSAEMSVYNSVFNSPGNGVDEIVVNIERKLKSLEGKKEAFSSITKMLTEAPYGIREGVIPLLVAKAISDLPDHFVMYFGRKEISLDANKLAKAVDRADEYKFIVQKGSSGKTDFLESLASLFSIPVTHSFWRDLAATVDGISKHFSMLPTIIRVGCVDDIVGIDLRTRKMVSEFLKFDINQYEIIFTTLPKLYSDSEYYSYRLLYDWIYRSLDILDSGLDSFIYVVSEKLQSIFGGSKDESLKSSIDSWILNNHISTKSALSLSSLEKRVFDVITSDRISFLDSDVVNLISKAATGTMIADWQNNKVDELCSIVSSVIKKMNQAEEKTDIGLKENVADTVPLSTLGEMAKNSVRSSMEEYGESISREEKIRLLKSLIQELME